MSHLLEAHNLVKRYGSRPCVGAYAEPGISSQPCAGCHSGGPGRIGVVIPLLFVLGYTVLALVLAVLTFRWDPDAAPLGLIGRAAHMNT
jgi:hypothetical protein